MSNQAEYIYDQLLVLRCLDGEVDALEEIVKRWQPRLWRHARRLTGDIDAASDATQEAWLSIVKGIRRVNDPAHFRAWAFRIVGNKCADWIRSRQRQRKIEEKSSETSEPAPSRIDSIEEYDELAKLRKALRSLQSDQFALLQMYYVEQMSVAEIAVALDIPSGTVKSRLHTARNELKELLERKQR